MKSQAKQASVYLYSRLDPVFIVAKILDKAFSKGNRVVVSCGSELALYDNKLWHYEQISFLPHTSKTQERKDFPIFLTSTPVLSQGEEVLVNLQAAYDKAILESFKKVCEVAAISESLAADIVAKGYTFKGIEELTANLAMAERPLSEKLKQLVAWGWEVHIWLKREKSAWRNITLGEVAG